MSLIYVLLPVGLLLAASAVAAFVWCVRSGQLDDLDSPAVRMLNDDIPTAASPPRGAGTTPAEAPGRPF